MPPSTTSAAPVISEESSEASHSAACAISDARPKRPMGMCTSRRARRCGSLRSSASIGVSIGPGHRALALMPRRAYSTAISLVMASTPPLLAVYAICGVAAPTSATNDATLMIEPPPERRRAGMPYLHPSHTPFRLMLITRSQIASAVSTVPSSSAWKMPALLYRTCRPPNVSTANRTIASTSAGLETSARTNAAWPPADLISCAASSPVRAVTSAITTLAPSAANRFAAVRPIPLAAPVINATLSFRRMHLPPHKILTPPYLIAFKKITRQNLRSGGPSAALSGHSQRVLRSLLLSPSNFRPLTRRASPRYHRRVCPRRRRSMDAVLTERDTRAPVPGGGPGNPVRPVLRLARAWGISRSSQGLGGGLVWG